MYLRNASVKFANGVITTLQFDILIYYICLLSCYFTWFNVFKVSHYLIQLWESQELLLYMNTWRPAWTILANSYKNNKILPKAVITKIRLDNWICHILEAFQRIVTLIVTTYTWLYVFGSMKMKLKTAKFEFGLA